MYKLKYRISTCLCIILLAVQINSLVNAAEISDGTEAELLGESIVTEPEVIENIEDEETVVSDEEVTVQDENALKEDIGEVSGETEEQIVGAPENESVELVEAVEENASDESVSAENEETDDVAEDKEVVDLDVPADVVAMQVPKNLDFVLDPCELMEKGSIWSQEYAFKNSGETPILLKFSNIQLFLQDEISMATDDMTDEDVAGSSSKVVRLLLLQNETDQQDETEADKQNEINETEMAIETDQQEKADKPEPIKVTKEGCEYEIILEPGQEFGFVVGGQISRNPNTMWQTGDVSIKMIYAAEVYREAEKTEETKVADGAEDTALLSK